MPSFTEQATLPVSDKSTPQIKKINGEDRVWGGSASHDDAFPVEAKDNPEVAGDVSQPLLVRQQRPQRIP